MDRMASLIQQFEILSKKLACSSAVVAWTFLLSLGSGVADPCSPKVLCRFLAEERFISQTGMYRISFTYEGIIHLLFSCVHVTDSRILTTASMAKRRAPTCEQASQSPAMQLQRAMHTFPSFSTRSHVFRGVSLARCELS